MPEFRARPQDLVITLLGAYLPARDQAVWSGGLVRLLGELGFSTAAARMALTRLVGRDLLSRVRDGRRIHYRVTPRCAALLREGDERIFALGRTPRRAEDWTVLWHALPDERRTERGRLARRLRFLGFGNVQDATWIAAHDREREVAALLGELDIAAYAGLLVGRPAGSLDFAGLARRAWDFDDLAARYRGFVETFGPYADTAARRIDERDAFLLRTQLAHVFRAFPFLDPELPADVMTPPEHRGTAVALFHRLFAGLRAPAQRHFDAAVA